MIYLLLILANVIWGLNIVITKLNYDSFHPVFLIFLKLFFSFLAMCFVIKFKKLKFEKIEIKELLVNTNCINVINFLFTYFALQNVKGVISATINCLAPFIMMLITFFYHHYIHKKTLLLLLLSVFGFLCTIHFQISGLSMGHFFLIIALFFYNFGNYRLKKQNQCHILIYNTYMLFIAFIEMTIIALFYRNQLFHDIQTFYLWLFLLTSGIGYAFIQSVYFYSIQKIGPLKTSVFFGLSPIFTCIFSIIILKEEADLFLITGFLIILFSSLYYIYQSKNPKDNI